MALNRLVALVPDDIIFTVNQYAKDNDIHVDEAVSNIVTLAFLPPPDPVIVTQEVPGALPVDPATLADIADLAASTGISYELAVQHVVATGMGRIKELAAIA